MSEYKMITVRDLVKFVEAHPELYKKGLDTPIVSGDFECNYTHGKHEIQHCDKDDKLKENVVCLGYEMHESIYD